MTHDTTHEPPRFKHSPCGGCKYLGLYRSENGEWDLYFCDGGGIQTLLARWSDEPSEYLSGSPDAAFGGAFTEARRRAIEAGYLPAEMSKPEQAATGIAKPAEWPEPPERKSSQAQVLVELLASCKFLVSQLDPRAWDTDPRYTSARTAIAHAEAALGKGDE